MKGEGTLSRRLAEVWYSLQDFAVNPEIPLGGLLGVRRPLEENRMDTRRHPGRQLERHQNGRTIRSASAWNWPYRPNT